MDGGRADGTTVAAAGGVNINDGLPTLQARVCGAWLLPGDPSCASVARRTFQRVAGALPLDPAVTDDGVTMVSELAANTLHAQRELRTQRDLRAERGQRCREPHPVTPELWLYLRGAGPCRELVCKVFDAFPGWLRGNAPGRGSRRAPADAVSGRGLEVVHELSQGRWGYHLTRSRLAGWQVRGKAVWFAVPAMTTSDPAAKRMRMSARAAMTEFEEALTVRGFTGKMVRSDDPAGDMAVLSVCSGLTVWCWSGMIWLRAQGASRDQRRYCDLIEVAEQTVEAYETLDASPGPALPAEAIEPGLPVAP